MDAYRIYFKKSVEKDLEKIPAREVKKIISRIEKLSENPRPPECEKLTVDKNRYRIRQGHYRILYSVQDKEQSVWIVKVAHRKDVYR